MKQIVKLVDLLTEKGISRPEEREIIIYGLTAGIELMASIITTIVLGFIFGLAIESLIFLGTFAWIRTYAGGYHCKKAINCYFMSSGVIALVLGVAQFTPKELMFGISGLMLFLGVLVLLKLAPVETPSKPLDQVERKYYRKKVILHLGVECIAIPILFFLKVDTLAFMMALGIMVAGGLVALQVCMEGRNK